MSSSVSCRSASSDEESTLLELADVSVEGPEGVLDLLRTLTRDARAQA